MNDIRPTENYDIEEHMLSALELFHYSARFRDKLMVFVLQSPDLLEALMSDFRILLSAQIKTLIACPSSADLKKSLSQANLKGHQFKVLSAGQNASEQISATLVTDNIPVLFFGENIATVDLCQKAFHLANQLSAAKFFLVQKEPGLMSGDRFYSHLTPTEVAQLIKSRPDFNMPLDLLEVCHQAQQSYLKDVVILAGKSGSVFKELFTHRGSGTLLSNSYRNQIRRANKNDVSEIAFLLKPHIQNNSMLPMSDDKILEQINTFSVYTVNGEIIAAAKLNDFGDGAEMAKFCTLPRYQRKGRARRLALNLIDQARQQGKQTLFSLSLEPAMWEFLLSLGFTETTYSELPESWLKNYNTSRGSKAFLLRL